jgi:hypothetical protein
MVRTWRRTSVPKGTRVITTIKDSRLGSKLLAWSGYFALNPRYRYLYFYLYSYQVKVLVRSESKLSSSCTYCCKFTVTQHALQGTCTRNDDLTPCERNVVEEQTCCDNIAGQSFIIRHSAVTARDTFISCLLVLGTRQYMFRGFRQQSREQDRTTAGKIVGKQ